MAATQAIFYRDRHGVEPVDQFIEYTRYRVLYQRSGNLIVLLHAFEKNAGTVPRSVTAVARRRMADFKRRMNAKPRKPPRAAGKDAPSVRR